MYVGDFGISKPILAEQSGMHSRVGTHDYVALEMFWGDYNDRDDERCLAMYCSCRSTEPWTCIIPPLHSPTTTWNIFRSTQTVHVEKYRFIWMLNQNDFSRDVIAILFEIMKPQPAERINVISFMELY